MLFKHNLPFCVTKELAAFKSSASSLFFLKFDVDVPACHLSRALVWSYTAVTVCPQIIRQRCVLASSPAGVASPCPSFFTHCQSAPWTAPRAPRTLNNNSRGLFSTPNTSPQQFIGFHFCHKLRL